MSDHKRFGIDRGGLTAHMKEGVDSLEKVHEICSQLHTSREEGLPSFPAHLSLRQSAFGKNEYSDLPQHHSLSFSTLLGKSYAELQPRFARNALIVIIVLGLIYVALAWLIHYGGGDEGDDETIHPLVSFISLLSILGPLIFLLLPVLMEAGFAYRKQAMVKNGLQRVRGKDLRTMAKRGGELTPVKFEDIVVGDIVQLKAGDVVPADGLLLQEKELMFDSSGSHASLGLGITAGSVVSRGQGEAVIVAVGENTQLSVITNEPPRAKETLPVTFILVIATVLGLTCIIVPISRFSLDTYVLQNMPWRSRHLYIIITMCGNGIDCFLTVIPHSLPFAVVWTYYRAKDNSQALFGIFKYIQFKVTLNTVIASLDFIKYAIISANILSETQEYWIHFFSIPLALLLYPTDSANINRPIKDASQIFALSGETLRNILGQVVWQLGLLIGLIFFGEKILDMGYKDSDEPTLFNTIVFHSLALMTLFNLFCVRMGRLEKNCFAGIWHHPIFCIFWICAVLLQLVVVQMGSLAFSTHPLRLDEHLICLCIALSVFIWTQILVCICLRKGKDQPNRAGDYEETEM